MAFFEQCRWPTVGAALWLVACGADAEDAATPAAGEADARVSRDAEPPPEGDAAAPTFACVPPTQAPPFPSGSPYVGVHANPQNNDLVPCDGASRWAPAWHALQGRAIAQPNTFSPDGRTVYVTSSAGSAPACTVHALDAATGRVLWCLNEEGALAGSVTVDAEGRLYTTTAAGVLSLTPAGQERWRRTWAFEDGTPGGPTGLHLHPSGHVAVVTGTGHIALLDRNDGAVVAELSVYEDVGLPRVERPGLMVDLGRLLPPEVTEDFVQTFGSTEQLFGIFAGVGKQWTDNTVGIAPDGTLYGIGTGRAADQGALVQVRVTTTDAGVTLTPGWVGVFNQGSASSPSISPDGRFVKVTDGNSTAGLLAPETVEARALLFEVAACDENRDADADPARCAPALTVPLLSGPALGASPVLNDGEHYAWEVQFANLFSTEVPDLIRYEGAEEVWRLFLPDDAVWSSVLTLTNRHIIGTMTRFEPSEKSLLTIALPSTATSELVVVERATGALVTRQPTTDDSTSTVTVGADGALYVTQLGLLSGFALDTRITGGVMRFSPIAE
jgi:outer membrane protein assembly factor BamB